MQPFNQPDKYIGDIATINIYAYEIDNDYDRIRKTYARKPKEMNTMVHHMKLQPNPFEMIKSGQKTYELRLLDPKRQRVSVGDIIEFLKLPNNQEKIRARVIALHPFANFAELYAVLPLLQCGYTEDEVSDASPDDMERYYSTEEQAKWGVVGIELELLKDWRDSNITRTSRYISLILRHKPDVIGIQLDKSGWASVQELIQGVNKTHPLDMALLEEIVATDEKQRYSFNADKSLIRANQGHSVPVDVELEEIDPPEYLWHGTATKYVADIERAGLIAKSRLYVHLSVDMETAIKVGSRHGSPVVFLVRAGQMRRDGEYKFYRSANGVWLSLDYAYSDKQNESRNHPGAFQGVIDTLKLCQKHNKKHNGSQCPQ